MKRKILLALTLIIFLIGCVSCHKKENSNEPVKESNNSQQLQIFKTDLKLTQDQVLSRIKAEHLKKNGGYLDSDEIITLVTLPGDALIDTYNQDAYKRNKSVSEYASSDAGIKQAKLIKNKQDKLISKLYANNLIIDVETQYSTIINAIAVKTTYGNFKKIGYLEGVDSTIISDTYNLPKAEKGSSNVVTNNVEVYPTGIFDSSSVSYDGEGTAVAILDSGFDCSHTVFANQPSNPLITMESISRILANTNAIKYTPDLEINDVYYSRKIPYMYDYADKDPDVFPYDSEHGTHVGGIIGGKDNEITGVAINTQLVFLKVFPDLSEGGRTEDILLALEDAVLLGVDAINMSLGSSCGFAREEDGSKINEVYDKINDSGISLITAASNSYSSAYGGEQGNTNLATNPDSGTVGSPSTYEAALSVASISGVKSKYLVGNSSQVIFFDESNDITGEENDFFGELGITEGVEKTFEYVTVPGVGKAINYANINVQGKIALVRRGDNTFEEKAQIAKEKGAVACIIYNNIEGSILMSMGKTNHIPTISISKEDGVKLAAKESGTLTISASNQAGPFMSDFSSWGPTPSLGLKPEITAHGGNIRSAIPGGGYDELSGTSMATPNLCGIVVLIRQYLKGLYPNYSYKQISVMTNQLLMSTASIALNEQGNPYSPRKQGAGLASLYNAVNTKGYITVDGIDRSKLELLDDPKREGVYTMEFNVVNLADYALTYDLSVLAMTETLSTSDNKFVAEKSQILSDNARYEIISGGTINGSQLVIPANQMAKLKVVYTLTQEDKNMIDSSFPYGMYVEGFVKLKASDSQEEGYIPIDLNIPFLAFYGDWTEAPLFDKTYYEVESEAHDASIDDEDKLKADYYATTPYGSYYYNYIIPLGSYLYDVDTSLYDEIPASTDRIAVSNFLGAIDGISAVYAGLLRNAKTVDYVITDKITGEVIWEYVDYNATKAYGYNGTPLPYYDFLRISSYQLGLVNNRQYSFSMKAKLDYGDGGEAKNIRNTFQFDFVLDNEAPILKDVTYEKIYDTTLRKDRYYITMVIYDNQYVQSVSPIIFTSNSSYTFLSDNPIPVYSEKGTDNRVRFEITDYLDAIYDDKLCTSAIGLAIDDYALNSNLYLCQLPGTRGDFRFTKDGTNDGEDLMILNAYQDDIIDLTRYLASTDKTLDPDKSYLNHLIWTVANPNIAEVKEGILVAKNTGRTVVTVEEPMYLRRATLIVNIKAKPATSSINLASAINMDTNINDARVESIKFSYFDTLFAYSRAAQTSEIGETGDRTFLTSLSSIGFYPGEKIQLFYDINPWYVDDKYEKVFESSNPNVASVDQDGVVTALKKGNATITLRLNGSNAIARVRLTVKSEFVIENRMLIAYKGLGGDVVIPDDEGILYIASYAFCLYDTDRNIEVTEEDYDANKIPKSNTTIKSVVVPDGVLEIQKYAFYNCSGLERVEIPDTVKIIREYAFAQDVKLSTINLDHVEVVGRECFKGCEKLTNLDFSRIYTIGENAFEGCTSLQSADLTNLRNTGKEAFKDCTALTNVVLSENTKLAEAMFVNTGILKIDIYEKKQIPAFCFAQCANLKEVNIHNNLLTIDKGAFCQNEKLTTVNFLGSVELIGEQVFYQCPNLESVTLPNNEVTLGNYLFKDCSNLTTIVFQENTKLTNINGLIFDGTKLTNFEIGIDNKFYTFANNLLLDKTGTIIIFATPTYDFGDYVVTEDIKEIASGAFGGAKIKSITFNGPIIIGSYAFANCKTLETVVFAQSSETTIGDNAFAYTESLNSVTNLDQVLNVGKYAFRNTGLENAILANDATYGEGAFFQSHLVEVTIGKNANLGFGAFQECSYLTTVNMPDEGNVTFGEACFARDTLLSTIDLSKVGQTIANETFYGCTALRSANLTNVKTIGDYAFADCSSLNYLNIPVVESIGEGAFGRYSESGSAPIISEVIFPTTLQSLGEGAFLGCLGLTNVTLPNSLEAVNNYMFAFCTNLTTVNLPTTIKTIGEFSFAGCEALETINLESVETISDYAFTSCAALTNVSLTATKTIGFGSFADCQNLESIGTTNNLIKVDQYAFQQSGLTEVDAPNLETINDFAFQMSANLTSFVFSNNLKHIGIGVFDGASSIEKYYVKDGNNLVDNAKINTYAQLIDGILYICLDNGKLILNSIPAHYQLDVLEVEEGTIRIETYAGNENNFINTIVLPDSLKAIGNYAFYEFDNLQTVEFKSFTAPILENSYDEDATLSENDPGYDLLHNQFDLFGLELCYFNFVDLVGKVKPLKMVLPANSDIEGYDSVIYLAYFGTVESSKRSDYEAMHSSMSNFIDYAEEIDSLKLITLNHETLVNNALSALNMVKQDPTNYGITMDRWNHLVEVVNSAKETIRILKLALASQTLKDLNDRLSQLPVEFKVEDIEELRALAAELNALTRADRSLLDLTNYNKLNESYQAYLTSLQEEANSITSGANNNLTITIVGVILASTIAPVAAIFFIRKRNSL